MTLLLSFESVPRLAFPALLRNSEPLDKAHAGLTQNLSQIDLSGLEPLPFQLDHAGAAQDERRAFA